MHSWPGSAAESLEPATADDSSHQPLESIASLGTALADKQGRQYHCIHGLESTGPAKTGRVLRRSSQVDQYLDLKVSCMCHLFVAVQKWL